MSTTRLNYFLAKPNQVDELDQFLQSVLPIIASSAGCVSCEVLQSQQSPEKFVVLEVWESVDAHKTAVEAIPQESFAGIMGLLSERPSGEFFVNTTR